jgi:hypothetical protein
VIRSIVGIFHSPKEKSKVKTPLPLNEFKSPSIQSEIESLSERAAKILALIQKSEGRGDTKASNHADLCAVELSLFELNNSLRNRNV